MNPPISRFANIIGLCLSLSLSFSLQSCGSGGKTPAQQQPAGVLVKTQTIESTTVETRSEYVGTLEANQIVTLKPEIDGTVSEIFVDEGNSVEVGTPILALKAEKGQASLDSALANVNAAQAAKNNAEAQYNALNAEKRELEAELDLQTREMKRISSLVKEGALPKRDLDTAERDLKVAQARLVSIEEQIQGNMATIKQNQAILAQAQASANLSWEQLQDTQIKSPITGIVGDLAVKKGDYVEQGDELTVITDNQNLNLNFFVPIEQAPQLRLELPIELIDYRTRKIIGQGQVSFIGPEVDFQSQTLLAKARFPNENKQLFTGQLVKAQLIWEQGLGIAIPVTSISRIGRETFVFVVEKQNDSNSSEPQLIAKQKAVKLGNIQNNNYQVLEGLKIGEQLIISGILNLIDGTPIIIQNQEK